MSSDRIPSRVEHTIRSSVVWLIGTIIVPASLIVFLILVKNANFFNVVDQGSLITTAMSVAGASVAIEMILEAKGLFVSLYQAVQLALLLSCALFFAGTSTVDHKHQVTTVLDTNKIYASIIALCLTAVFGIIAVTRQAWQSYVEAV